MLKALNGGHFPMCVNSTTGTSLNKSIHQSAKVVSMIQKVH